MSLTHWRRSGSKSLRLGQGRRFQSEHNETQSRWSKFWRKLKGDKRKNFNSSMTMQQPYDPETYMQNFDDGENTMEPENLFRSFSARYADPSRSGRRKELLVDDD